MVGRKISHYEILRKLGQGGMGVVYLARDADLDRLVALKFLPTATADSAERIARFLREARAISALNHPHIAIIYSIEETIEFKFLALEYLPGGTLKKRIREAKARGERMALRLAVEWTAQIAEGLAHAHRRGLVHRDVKPSNVLFTEEGRIKIADFGLAKKSAESPDPTETGLAIGTPRCMSPEQALGRAVDERSDIFSLGIVLFELIAGEPPFHAGRAATLMHEIVYKTAPPLSGFRDGVPPALQMVVTKALEKDPAARFQSMEELISALRASEGLLESASLSSSTVTLPCVLSGGRKRRPKLGLAAAIAATALMAGIVGTRFGLSHGSALPAEKRIAVLEFTNIGADPKNQPLVDRLMEVTANSLTRLESGSLQVVPAADIRRKGIASAGEAWQKEGASLAITGSVSRSGDAVQVMINLADTRSVTQLRTDALETDLADPALSQRVVEKIAGMLEALNAKPLSVASARSPRTELHYLEALGVHRNGVNSR
jgi:eukaryotic-like serine/threonine-protein kinase